MTMIHEFRDQARSYTMFALGWEHRGAQRWATARLLNTGTALSLSGAATVDGVVANNGDIVVETTQSNTALNGPWTVAAGAWTRPSIVVGNGLIWNVLAGAANSGRWTTLTAPYDKFVLGTSLITIQAATGLTTTLSADESKQPRAIGVDTTGGAMSLLLPSDYPYEGMEFRFFDTAPAGSFGTNALTLSGNGKTINGAALLLLNNFKSPILRFGGGTSGGYNTVGI